MLYESDINKVLEYFSYVELQDTMTLLVSPMIYLNFLNEIESYDAQND